MTIKNTDKNVSAENDEVVADVTYSDNGILTIVRKNLYNDTEVENKNVDLSDHKLKLKIVTQERLTALEDSTTPSDIHERESYIFLVSLGESEPSSEGYYREYIWVEGNDGGEFEAMGSTKIDLTNYIQKTSGTNLLLANGENIAQSTFATAAALTNKENTSNKVTAMSSSSTNTQYPSAKAVYDALPKTTKTLTVTYTDNTTEDIEFYVR